MVLADHRCKCTHLKSDHTKWHGICKNYSCGAYLKLGTPDIWSKAMLGVGIVATGFFVALLVMVSADLKYFEESNPEFMEMQVDMTHGDFFYLMFVFFGLFVFMICTFVSVPMITRYFYEKQRRDYN